MGIAVSYDEFALLKEQLQALQSLVAQQNNEIAQLKSGGTNNPATPARKPFTTSRRKLLKSLAIAAAGTAATATALGNAQNAAATNSAATSSPNFGFSAAPGAVNFFSPTAGSYGLIGVTSNGAGFPIATTANNDTGVFGFGTFGVRGTASDTNATTASFDPTSILNNPNGVVGVRGESLDGWGVLAVSTNGDALHAYSLADGEAVYGNSANNHGVHGYSGRVADGTGSGVWGAADGGAGVRGESINGVGGSFNLRAGGIAKAQLELVPSGAAGPPAFSANHSRGELYMDTNTILWLCTAAGNPGTWIRVNNKLNNLNNDVNITAGAGISVTPTAGTPTVAGTIAVANTGVLSVTPSGGAAVTGAVTLAGAGGVSVAATGQTITITGSGGGGGGGGVTSVNTVTGAVNIQQNGTTVTPSGQNINLTNVASLNTLTGAVNLTAGTGIAIPAPTGNNLTVNNTGVTGVVAGASTLTGNVTLAAGSNITLTPSGNTLTIASTGSGGGGGSTISFLSSPIRITLTLPTDAGALSSDGSQNPNATFKSVQVTGVSVGGLSVPAGAKAIIGSLTSVGATNSGNLRLWPTGGSVPNVNTLNIPAKPDGTGYNLTTSVTVGLSADGKVSIGYSNGISGAKSGYALDVAGFIL